MEPTLSAHQTEYSDAAMDWFREAVGSLKLELHPLLAATPREHVGDLPRPEEHSVETADLASPLYRGIPIRHEMTMNIADLIGGDVDSFLTTMFVVADETGKQLIGAMVQHISDVSDTYGNTVSVGEGGFVEAFIDALESMELSFNDDGSPSHTLLMHPNMAEELQRNPPTPDQEQRIEEITNRKREEWRASRRRQDLP